MRDVLVFSLILLSLPWCFRRPFFGLLMFTGLAYFRPQDLCWGFARTMRFSLYVGITMFAGYFAVDAGRRPFFRRDLRTVGMILLLVLTLISTVPAEVVDEYVISGLFEFTVIIAVALFSSGQLDSRQRLRLLLWCIALGLGFYGIKGGIFGLLGGRSIHQGPGGMMKDNNDFALAMAMVVPMLWHLGASEKNPLIKRFAHVATGLTCLTVLLTHSRGGFLSMVVAWLFIAYRSRKLIQVVLTGLVMTVLLMQVVPASVFERLSTIQEAAEGEGDSSVEGRLRAWSIGLRMVRHNPVLGVGHKNFRQHYERHALALFPGGDQSNRVAHNSYVQIWAETGTPAFLIFVIVLLSTFPLMGRVRRMARGDPELAWAVRYANLIEASLAAFVVGGFFLNRGHFDLSYHLIGIGVGLAWVVRTEVLARTSGAPVDGDASASNHTRLRWRPVTGGPGELAPWDRRQPLPAGFDRMPATGDDGAGGRPERGRSW